MFFLRLTNLCIEAYNLLTSLCIEAYNLLTGKIIPRELNTLIVSLFIYFSDKTEADVLDCGIKNIKDVDIITTMLGASKGLYFFVYLDKNKNVHTILSGSSISLSRRFHEHISDDTPLKWFMEENPEIKSIYFGFISFSLSDKMSANTYMELRSMLELLWNYSDVKMFGHLNKKFQASTKQKRGKLIAIYDKEGTLLYVCNSVNEFRSLTPMGNVRKKYWSNLYDTFVVLMGEKVAKDVGYETNGLFISREEFAEYFQYIGELLLL